jgi:hypothetical protein
MVRGISPKLAGWLAETMNMNVEDSRQGRKRKKSGSRLRIYHQCRVILTFFFGLFSVLRGFASVLTEKHCLS